MANPEGTFALDINPQDTLTRKHVGMLGIAIGMLVEAHDLPDSLELVASEQDRYFSRGGILAVDGFTPELTLARDDNQYTFLATLLDPDRYTAATIANNLLATYSISRRSATVKTVRRTFIPPIGAAIRNPGSHELRASAAIASVAKATERLSREPLDAPWIAS